jgi:predicted ATP-grasp superfamily ATP-dependent carboligase
MTKNLLILGAGIESIEAYLQIKKYKCKLVIADNNPEAPGVKYADIFIKASIRNYSQILKKLRLKKIKIHGIISFGDVSYVETKLSKYFKIKTIPLESAKITSNKYLFKKKMKNYFNIPYFEKISSLRKLKIIISKKKNNFILKPVDNSGARGVIVINKKSDLKWAYKYCKKYSKKKYLVIEKFINGPQLSTEGIVFNGEYIHLCTFDRNYEMIKKYNPFIIENGGSTPSKIGDRYQSKIIKILSKISKKLKLYNASIKGDLILNGNRIYLIEIATRLSGGWLSSVIIPNCSGVNILDYKIRNALNLEINKNNIIPRHKRIVIQRYLFPEIGKIKSINLKNRSLLNNKNILAFKLFVKKGKIIDKIDSHASRIGHVIVKSRSLRKGVLFVNKLLNNVNIKYY